MKEILPLLMFGLSPILWAAERNVAFASEGSFVSVDSLSAFGRNDATYGGFDFECKPEQLTDGRYVTDPTQRLPHGNRWISQVDRKHPHWAWIGFAGPRMINRVVVRCSSVENYPTDFRGQYSPDNGISLKDLFVVKDQKPDAMTMVMEFKFAPVAADNFRLFIERSATTSHSNFTQLSEIEVYGEGDAIRPQIESAPGLRDVQPLLIAKSDNQVQIEERADEIEIRSPWQKLVFSRAQPQITCLAWDSEGQGKLDINLLGVKGTDGIQPRVTPAYRPVKALPAASLKRDGNVMRYGPFEAADGLWMNWEIKVGAKEVEMAVTKEASHAMMVRPGVIHFDLDAGQTPITPYYRPGKLGLVGLPCLLQAPDCGAVLVESAPGSMAGFFERAAECQALGKTWWSYFDLTDDFPTRPDGLVEIKPGVRQGVMRWSVQHVTPVPALTAKEPRLAGLSRYALNGMPFRPDTDLLGNSITSINCGFCMFEYAEMAQWLPVLPGGIDPCDLLRRSLDTYFAGTWAHDCGPAYMLDPNSGYNTTLDTKPALIYAAWTVVRKTGEVEQLRRWLPYLERLGTLMEETAGSDGLLQTIKSTRGGGWYDVIRDGGKSAYGNALGFRAFQYLADLESLLGRNEQSKRFSDQANRIRAAYYPALFNPETGVIAGWKTEDGKLHDYWFPWVNGMAIIYGLVPEPEANKILDRLQAKFKEVGFHRFDLGMPNCLINIPSSDYAVDNKFQQYLNGGAAPCYAYWYIQAMYQTGRRTEADAMLWPLIKSYGEGLFNGGVAGKRGDPVRGEWHDWSGNKSGGEGFLPDCYHAFNALYNGYFGITFQPEGYRIAPWSPLKGSRTTVGLQYMGKTVEDVE
ncbi:MAG: hypothetical protein NTW21_27220 [Verrucomicrobia bacterium]|nr:hypothetical protein [Verrucomicrobiota bacterium]